MKRVERKLQRSVLALISAVALMSGCSNPFQADERPPTVAKSITEAFVRAGVPVHDVEVKVDLPTSLPVVVVPTVAPRLDRVNFAGVPEGSYTFAYAVHYKKVVEDGEEDVSPVVLGATVVHSWNKEVKIDVESTALYLVLYHGGIDWNSIIDPDKLGLSGHSQNFARNFYEKLEFAVKSDPDFAELKREVERHIRQGRELFDVGASPASQGSYEPQAVQFKIVLYAVNILSRLYVAYNAVTAVKETGEALEHTWNRRTGSPFDIQLDSNRLIIQNKLPVPIGVGLLQYETEERTPYEAILEKREFVSDFVSGLSAIPKSRAEFSLNRGKYLGCVMGHYGDPAKPEFGTTNQRFPTQDLLSRLEEGVEESLAVQSIIIALYDRIRSYPGDDNIRKADLSKAALRNWERVVRLFLSLAGVDKTIEKTFTEAIEKEIERLDRLIGSGSKGWRSKDALWKQSDYEDVREEAEKFVQEEHLTKKGDIDLRRKVSYEATIQAAKFKKAMLTLRLILTKVIFQIPKVSDLITASVFAGSLLNPIQPDCYEIDTEKGLLKKTGRPNIAVSPNSIENGQKDTPYQFTVKILHLDEKTNTFNLAWNFGDATAGQKSITAARSPHTEYLTHTYRDAGAYGALFQLDSPSNRASQFVGVYIGLPRNENNYNLNICDVWRAANGGGYGITEDLWDISVIRPPGGQKAVFDIYFDTYYIPDRIFVYYPPGNLVLDTGWRGSSSYNGDPLYPGGIAGPGEGQFNRIFVKGSVDQFKVVVVGPDEGTAWVYSVRCRFVSDSAQTQGVGVVFGPREVLPDPEAVPRFPGRGEGR